MTGFRDPPAQGAARAVADAPPAGRRGGLPARRPQLAAPRPVHARRSSRRSAGDQFQIVLPTPTAADAVDQLVKNLSQFGILVAVLLAMGSVATEKERGTAALILDEAGRPRRVPPREARGDRRRRWRSRSRWPPPRRGSTRSSCSRRSPSPGSRPRPSSQWLALMACAAITFLGSTLTRSALAAAGIGVVAFIVIGDPVGVSRRSRRTCRSAWARRRGRSPSASRSTDAVRPIVATVAARSARRSRRLAVVPPPGALTRRQITPGDPERRDLGRGVAELGEDLVRVLAEERRRRPDRGRRRATASNGGRPAVVRPSTGCSTLDRHLPGDRLARCEGRRDVVDRAGRDVGRVERREPLGGRPLREALAQRRDQLDPVRDAVAVRGEPRVVGERRQPERAAEARPLALAADRDRDLAVGRLERLVRDDVRVGVAEAARRDAVDERVLGLVHEHRQRRLEDRDVDPLAGPAGRRRRRRSRPASAARIADGAVEPGQRRRLIATPTFVGPPPSASARAGDRHQPRLGLDDEVVAGPAAIRPGRAVAA